MMGHWFHEKFQQLGEKVMESVLESVWTNHETHIKNLQNIQQWNISKIVNRLVNAKYFFKQKNVLETMESRDKCKLGKRYVVGRLRIHLAGAKIILYNSKERNGNLEDFTWRILITIGNNQVLSSSSKIEKTEKFCSYSLQWDEEIIQDVYDLWADVCFDLQYSKSAKHLIFPATHKSSPVAFFSANIDIFGREKNCDDINNNHQDNSNYSSRCVNNVVCNINSAYEDEYDGTPNYSDDAINDLDNIKSDSLLANYDRRDAIFLDGADYTKNEETNASKQIRNILKIQSELFRASENQSTSYLESSYESCLSRQGINPRYPSNPNFTDSCCTAALSTQSPDINISNFSVYHYGRSIVPLVTFLNSFPSRLEQVKESDTSPADVRSRICKVTTGEFWLHLYPHNTQEKKFLKPLRGFEEYGMRNPKNTLGFLKVKITFEWNYSSIMSPIVSNLMPPATKWTVPPKAEPHYIDSYCKRSKDFFCSKPKWVYKFVNFYHEIVVMYPITSRIAKLFATGSNGCVNKSSQLQNRTDIAYNNLRHSYYNIEGNRLHNVDWLLILFFYFILFYAAVLSPLWQIPICLFLLVFFPSISYCLGNRSYIPIDIAISEYGYTKNEEIGYSVKYSRQQTTNSFASQENINQPSASSNDSVSFLESKKLSKGACQMKEFDEIMKYGDFASRPQTAYLSIGSFSGEEGGIQTGYVDKEYFRNNLLFDYVMEENVNHIAGNVVYDTNRYFMTYRRLPACPYIDRGTKEIVGKKFEQSNSDSNNNNNNNGNLVNCKINNFQKVSLSSNSLPPTIVGHQESQLVTPKVSSVESPFGTIKIYIMSNYKKEICPVFADDMPDVVLSEQITNIIELATVIQIITGYMASFLEKLSYSLNWDEPNIVILTLSILLSICGVSSCFLFIIFYIPSWIWRGPLFLYSIFNFLIFPSINKTIPQINVDVDHFSKDSNVENAQDKTSSIKMNKNWILQWLRKKPCREQMSLTDYRCPLMRDSSRFIPNFLSELKESIIFKILKAPRNTEKFDEDNIRTKSEKHEEGNSTINHIPISSYNSLMLTVQPTVENHSNQASNGVRIKYNLVEDQFQFVINIVYLLYVYIISVIQYIAVQCYVQHWYSCCRHFLINWWNRLPDEREMDHRKIAATQLVGRLQNFIPEEKIDFDFDENESGYFNLKDITDNSLNAFYNVQLSTTREETSDMPNKCAILEAIETEVVIPEYSVMNARGMEVSKLVETTSEELGHMIYENNAENTNNNVICSADDTKNNILLRHSNEEDDNSSGISEVNKTNKTKESIKNKHMNIELPYTSNYCPRKNYMLDVSANNELFISRFKPSALYAKLHQCTIQSCTLNVPSDMLSSTDNCSQSSNSLIT